MTTAVDAIKGKVADTEQQAKECQEQMKGLRETSRGKNNLEANSIQLGTDNSICVL